jgi:hypothetical protein
MKIEKGKLNRKSVHAKATHLSDCIVGGVATREGDKCVSSICAGHWVHHQTQVPDRTTFFEQWDQLVLVHVLWNFAAKHFAAVAWRSRFPIWWWSAVFSLT